MIRLASYDDFNTIMDMIDNFIEEANFQEFYDRDQVVGLITEILHSDQTKQVILINEDKGLIGGTLSALPFTPKRIAVELMWWVKPEHRGSAVGQELLESFQNWARNVAGCEAVVMTSLDERVGKFYEKNNFKLYERVYYKVI